MKPIRIYERQAFHTKAMVIQMMFQKAKPIWIRGAEEECNCSAVFTTEGDFDETVLHVAAFTFYRLYADGKFLAFGPARAAEGYARVDVIPLPPCRTLRIEAVGYACRSLASVKQPSFFAAEVIDKEGNVLAASDVQGDFICRRLCSKIQKTERYSQQRHFGEIWDFSIPDSDVCPCADVNPPVFLPRTAPYPAYHVISPTALNAGTFVFDETRSYRENRYSFKGSEYWGEYRDIPDGNRPFVWIQRQAMRFEQTQTSLPAALGEGDCIRADFGMLCCGFFRACVHAYEDTELVIGFTEYCEDGTFAFSGINAQNVILYRIPGGETMTVQSFEPYTARCAVLLVRRGALMLNAYGMTTYEHAMKGAFRPTLPNASLQSIYDAALRTFAHNAVDLYTDCPSRERAGWLCDSYFTAKVEYFLFGECPVEDAFLENYCLFRSHPVIPTGMLPMCYPADTGHLESQPYIPQWCMWYVLEVREYLTERNPGADREAFRAGVTGIVEFLSRFENEDGLLEDLPGWNFVEWSDANSWVQNVNYPTNFLYAEVLRAYDALYGGEGIAEKAARICKTAAEQSFDGELFCDHAVRHDGDLVRTVNTSEAGQYYALLFGDLDLSDPRYMQYYRHVLTGCRDLCQDGRCFVPVNAFIGLYLRILTLLKLKEYDILLSELDDFFGGMVEKTQTLWEYRQLKGSHDHGFASYAAVAMTEALRGLGRL